MEVYFVHKKVTGRHTQHQLKGRSAKYTHREPYTHQTVINPMVKIRKTQPAKQNHKGMQKKNMEPLQLWMNKVQTRTIHKQMQIYIQVLWVHKSLCIFHIGVNSNTKIMLRRLILVIELCILVLKSICVFLIVMLQSLWIHGLHHGEGAIFQGCSHELWAGLEIWQSDQSNHWYVV